MRKRWIVVLIVLAMLAGGGFYGYRYMTGEQGASAANTALGERATVTRGTLQVTSLGTGNLEPPVEVALAFDNGGRLTQVPVVLGQHVVTGTVLAQLDTSDLQTQVAQAEASLASAQANLEKTRAGALPSDLAAAQATLRNSQANYDQVAKGSRAEDIAAAQASLRNAQANYQKVAAGTRPEQLTQAAADMETAAAAVQSAQAAYDKISWAGNVSATSQAVALQQATLAYQKAKAAYEELKNGNLPEDVAVAKAQVDQAQAALDKLKNTPTADDLAIAQAQVDLSQAQLDKLTSSPTPQDIAIAQAAVDQAQAALDQAQLTMAKATLRAPMEGVITAVNLNPGELAGASAPIVSLEAAQTFQVDINLDETAISQVAIGQVAQVQLDALPNAKLTGKVIQIAPKAVIQSGVVIYPVTVSLDTAVAANPGAAPRADQQGAVNPVSPSDAARNSNRQQAGAPSVAMADPPPTAAPYTNPVGNGGDQQSVSLVSTGSKPGRDNQGAAKASATAPLPLLAGMTANVTIVLEQSQNTLIVPLRAVSTRGNQAFVTRVAANGTAEQVSVKLGLMNDTQAEILSGLSEGDTVLVAATQTNRGGFGGPGGPGGGPFRFGG
jgi:HlyD family secretion protein